LKHFLRTIILYFFTLNSSVVYSQDVSDPIIIIDGSVNNENYEKISGVKVEIKQDNQIFKSVVSMRL
jgi:hypothetical protein